MIHSSSARPKSYANSTGSATKEWIGNRNAEARERVKAIVDRQRLIIAKLAKNGRRFQKLAGLIHELDIPGGLRELKSAISSRRR